VLRQAVDTTHLVEALDRSAAAWDAGSLHQAFSSHGCAVVRGAIDKSILSDVKSGIETAYARATDVHVTEHDLLQATDGRRSGFELIESSPMLRSFLDRVYGRWGWTRYFVVGRRIQGVERDKDWQPPLALHVDSQFHTFRFTVNFWVPFDDCGVDAPSLQLVPLNARETKRYSGFTRWRKRRGELGNLGYFQPGVFDVAAVTEAFGDNCFFRPAMSPGDVIISSNWIVHGSYQTREMRRGRTSAEIRFFGKYTNVRGLVQTARSAFKGG